MPQRYLMLVMANASDNNNKFYELTLEDDDRVVARYGRVGAAGMTEQKGHGSHTFDSVANQKKKKGYKEVSVAVSGGQPQAQKSLAEVAKRDLTGGDPNLAALIERLAAINRHQLMAATGGQIRIEDGQVKTPVGLVTLDSVKAAQALLAKIQPMVIKDQVTQPKYTSMLEEYLTLVPQRVPSRRGWGPGFFTEHTNFVSQNDLLDQLEGSIKTLEEDRKRATLAKNEDLPPSRLFSYGIQLMDDKKVVDEIEKFYKSQVNRMHASSSLRLKKVYTMANPVAAKAYEDRLAKVGNPQRLWHGTRAHNILSILKMGLIIPRSGGNYTITGRMFGDGLYFSDQSSKSLNYAHGYWDGGPRDNNCFMFLCQVALGRSFIPTRSCNGNQAGYDSCFAQAGKSGVANNEMIVYNLDQVQLTHLVEFDA